MREVFADTFFWVALVYRRDPSHERVRQISTALRNVRIVTTEEVLIEFLTFLAGIDPVMRVQGAALVRQLLRNPDVVVLPQSHTSFMAGLELYEQRPDKQYSGVDCISMRAMRERGIHEVLTQDHHFAQEGFVPLI